MKTTKAIIAGFILLIIWTSFVFLLTGFVKMEFDPKAWSQKTREAFVFLGPIIGICLSSFLTSYLNEDL